MTDIIRYIDKQWHHYAVQYPCFKPFPDWKTYKHSTADKKFSYLIEYSPSTNSIPLLLDRIREHMAVADHVYVNLAEPGLSYKTLGDPEGPYNGTVDFINNFKESDNVTFFGCVVLQKKTTRPLYFLNDMFFHDINLYQNFDICKNILKKLIPTTEFKKYSWEIMCGHHVDVYKKIKNHPVDRNTFSTCHSLGISYYGKDAIAPKNTPAETFSDRHNIRCSDLIDPDIYNQSYYSCVIETVIPVDNSFAMFSEKEAKPITAGRPFIIVGAKDHLKSFRSLGFKTFNPVIDESYDDEPNREKRISMILDSMEKLSKEDPIEVYKRLQPILEHNKKWFENKNNWNKEFLDAWHQDQSII